MSKEFEVGDIVFTATGKEYKVVKVYLKSRPHKKLPDGPTSPRSAKSRRYANIGSSASPNHKVKVVDVLDSKNRILKAMDVFYFNKSKPE